jgi:hypothetical protein
MADRSLPLWPKTSLEKREELKAHRAVTTLASFRASHSDFVVGELPSGRRTRPPMQLRREITPRLSGLDKSDAERDNRKPAEDGLLTGVRSATDPSIETDTKLRVPPNRRRFETQRTEKHERVRPAAEPRHRGGRVPALTAGARGLSGVTRGRQTRKPAATRRRFLNRVRKFDSCRGHHAREAKDVRPPYSRAATVAVQLLI